MSLASHQTYDDVVAIINRRRPAGSKIGTPIPSAPWFKLCETLYEKYNIDPLDLAVFELTDIDRFSKRNDKFELSDKSACENEEKETPIKATIESALRIF